MESPKRTSLRSRIVPKKKCRSFRTCGLKEGKKCRQEMVDECERVSTTIKQSISIIA